MDTPAIELTPSLFAMAVLAVTKQAVYLRLPSALQRTIDGGCDCTECKGKPGVVPAWDTLVCPIDSKLGSSYTVHMPDGSIPAFKAYVKAKGL